MPVRMCVCEGRCARSRACVCDNAHACVRVYDTDVLRNKRWHTEKAVDAHTPPVQPHRKGPKVKPGCVSEVSTTGHLWYYGHVTVLGVHADSSSLEAGDRGQGQWVSKGRSWGRGRGAGGGGRRREGKGVLGKRESLVGQGT